MHLSSSVIKMKLLATHRHECDSQTKMSVFSDSEDTIIFFIVNEMSPTVEISWNELEFERE